MDDAKRESLIVEDESESDEEEADEMEELLWEVGKLFCCWNRVRWFLLADPALLAWAMFGLSRLREEEEDVDESDKRPSSEFWCG